MPAPDDLIGRTIGGRLVIDELLGQGGMGAVYRARQLPLGRPVALKVIRAAHAIAPDAMDRFRREADVLGRISHPHVVTLLEFGVLDDGALFYVMELLQGHDLRAHLSRPGGMAVRDALVVARDVAAALAAVHALGVVHRDLKPENIFLVDGAGRVPFARVLDFGIARREVSTQETSDRTITGTGAVVGTPGYIAPEAVTGVPMGRAADVYALGVVLFEALAGKAPFEGSTPLGLVLAHVTQPVPALKGLRADVRDDVVALVEALLAKDPAARPVSVDVVAALDALLASPQPAAVAAVATAPLTSTMLPPATAAAPPDDRRPRRRGRAAVGAALLVIVAAMAAVALLPRGHPCSLAGGSSVREAAVAKAEAAHTAGDVTGERTAWRDAIAADPAFSAAYQRLVLSEVGFEFTEEVAADYRAALAHRDHLCPRDLALLDAVEPMMRATPDYGSYQRAAVAVAERFDDVRAWTEATRAAHLAGDAAVTLAAAEHVLAHGAAPAMVRQPIAFARWKQGDVAGALADLNQCLDKDPLSARCWWTKLALLNLEGRCVELADAAATWSRRGGTLNIIVQQRASALLALGRPVDEVAAVLDAAAATPAYASDGPRWRTWIAIAAGRWAEAERILEERRAAAGDASIGADLTLIALLEELGRIEEARVVTDDLRLKLARARPSSDVDVTRMRVTSLQRRLGALDEPTFVAARAAWLAQHTGLSDFERWDAAFAEAGEADARAAVAELDRIGVADWLHDDFGVAGLIKVGRAYLAVGRAQEALPWLERSAQTCERLATPFHVVQGELALGQAREAVGDVAGARDAYAAVIAHSSPPARTASEAARLLASLPP